MTEQIAQQISSNNNKMYFWMAVLTALAGIFGTIIGGVLDIGLYGTGLFLLIAGVANFVSFYKSDSIALKFSKAELADENKHKNIYDMLIKLSVKTQVPQPKLYIQPTPDMNAFATGRNYENAIIVLSQGIIDRLSEDEIEGVIAHEFSHIQNYDMRTMTVITVLAGSISILAQMYINSQLFNRNRNEGSSGALMLIGIILSILAPLAATLIRLSISRNREFIADANGAALTGNPSGLANALLKISGENHQHNDMPEAFAPLFISAIHPASLFSTHPPIEERVKFLNSY